MEVHSHTHTPRKKWTHYLWEFLMLFLAVFCGFLAENIREHKIENERARQFIRSEVKDLMIDTIRINRIIAADDEKIAVLNGIVECYDSISGKLKGYSCLRKLIIISKSNFNFEISDRTLRQLANAGGFRLLKPADADSILSYERSFRQMRNFESTVYQEAQDNVRNTLNLLADFKSVTSILRNSSLKDSENSNDEDPLLFRDDPILLNKWFNEMSIYLRVTNVQRNLLVALKEKAKVLMNHWKED